MGHASARSCKNAFNCCVDIWVFDRFVPGHVLRLSRSLGSPGLRAVTLDLVASTLVAWTKRVKVPKTRTPSLPPVSFL